MHVCYFSWICEEIVEVFMDGFFVYGTSFDNCLHNLDKVLQRCEETNLVLNWEKCHFMLNEGIVRGHKISERGIEADRAKVEAIEKMPCPRDVKGIRSILDNAGFYRRFIKDFSKISKPLTNLLQKDVPFVFYDDCKEAFETLKKSLTTTPIVQPPDWNLLFEIMCDASDFAVAAILGQRIDKKLNVIHYASKTLDAAQKNYATTEKEFLLLFLHVISLDLISLTQRLLFILIMLLLGILCQKRMLSLGLLDGCYFYKSLICIF
jgi:hypothetical protein